MPDIRILLVDDHPVLRLGVRELLAAEADIEVVGEAGDGTEAVRLVRELRPDVAVVDIAMPGIDGLETTRRIVALDTPCQVLILTVHAHEQYLLHLLEAGARGYVPKTVAFDKLVDAVRTVARGEVFLLPEAAKILVSGYIDKAAGIDPCEERLSNREREVLRRTAAGHTSSEIAEELVLSPNTVDTYRRRLMEKLGLRRRADLVRYAVRRGILVEDD